MARQVIYVVSLQWRDGGILFSSSLPFFALSSPFLPSNNLITFHSQAGLVDLVVWDD